MELGFLLRGPDIEGVRVIDLRCAPVLLVERVLASRAVYDPGQVFQCCMPNDGQLVRGLCRELGEE